MFKWSVLIFTVNAIDVIGAGILTTVCQALFTSVFHQDPWSQLLSHLMENIVCSAVYSFKTMDTSVESNWTCYKAVGSVGRCWYPWSDGRFRALCWDFGCQHQREQSLKEVWEKMNKNFNAHILIRSASFYVICCDINRTTVK